MDTLLRCLSNYFIVTLIFLILPSVLIAQVADASLKAQIEAQAAVIAAMEKRLSALENSEIACIAGKKVTGANNRWSPISTCPESYTPIGVERLDLEGSHELPHLHVNDLWCDQKGCRAWCVGSTCSVVTKCCKWQPGQLENGTQ